MINSKKAFLAILIPLFLASCGTTTNLSSNGVSSSSGSSSSSNVSSSSGSSSKDENQSSSSSEGKQSVELPWI